MGSMGITVHSASNNYQGNNKTSLKFDAKDEKVHIGEKVTLNAHSVHSLVFRNQKMYITEATGEQKGTYPSVNVCMEDAGLHFTIRFVGEHLDIYWNDVAAQSPESSGLIGKLCVAAWKQNTLVHMQTLHCHKSHNNIVCTAHINIILAIGYNNNFCHAVRQVTISSLTSLSRKTRIQGHTIYSFKTDCMLLYNIIIIIIYCKA